MSEQYIPRLGQVIDGAAFRDAIHIAVAPVEAGEPLAPGDRVGLDDGFQSLFSWITLRGSAPARGK